jgi:hypothetical protein
MVVGALVSACSGSGGPSSEHEATTSHEALVADYAYTCVYSWGGQDYYHVQSDGSAIFLPLDGDYDPAFGKLVPTPSQPGGGVTRLYEPGMDPNGYNVTVPNAMFSGAAPQTITWFTNYYGTNERWTMSCRRSTPAEAALK